MACLQRVDVVQQVAAGFLTLEGDAFGDDAFDDELGRRGVAAGGERLVARAQEPGFGEPALRLGQHDVGRDQPLVAGVVALEQRDHGADAGKDQPAAGRAPGLHQVGRRLVAVVAVRHAADDGVLVGLLGQQRQQFADPNAVHVGGDRLVQRTAVVVARFGLRIEGVQVRRAAPHPDLDDRLGFALGGAAAAAARDGPAGRPAAARLRPPDRSRSASRREIRRADSVLCDSMRWVPVLMFSPRSSVSGRRAGCAQSVNR